MKQIALDRFGTDEIISLYKDKPVIKVLQGIRRSGKSFMLELLSRKILESGAAEKNGEKLYVQVAYLISSEETKEKELRPLKSLLALGDNFPKLILTMDELPPSNENGIVRKNIREWILDM